MVWDCFAASWNCADTGENREARSLQTHVEGWPRLYSKYFLKTINRNKQNGIFMYLQNSLMTLVGAVGSQASEGEEQPSVPGKL